jgi:hypothetical protein
LKDLTPQQAFELLQAPPSQLRDGLRRAFLQAQEDAELIYWIGACAQELGKRHKMSEAATLQNLARLADYEDRASRAAAEQAATS